MRPVPGVEGDPTLGQLENGSLGLDAASRSVPLSLAPPALPRLPPRSSAPPLVQAQAAPVKPRCPEPALARPCPSPGFHSLRGARVAQACVHLGVHGPLLPCPALRTVLYFVRLSSNENISITVLLRCNSRTTKFTLFGGKGTDLSWFLSVFPLGGLWPQMLSKHLKSERGNK